MKFFIFYVMLAGTLLSFGGCSRSPEREAEEEIKAVVQVPEVAVVVEVAEVDTEEVHVGLEIPQEPVAIQKPELKPIRVYASDVPFRLSALLSGGGYGARAGLVSKLDGTSDIVSAGDLFLEYKIEEINYAGGEIVVSHAGQLMVLGQSGAVNVQERTVTVTSDDGETDLLKIKGPLFDSTPEEIDLGIDPNKSETWPDNYRGPAIERILKSSEGDDYKVGFKTPHEMSDEEMLDHGIEISNPEDDIMAEEDAFPETSGRNQFEPTENELSREIDPNNPNTWPEDYMGPGIERAMEKTESQ